MNKSLFFAINLSFWIISLNLKAQTPQEKIIIGDWRNGFEMGGTTLTFNTDKTYILIDDFQGTTDDKGTWKISKDVLTLTTKKKKKINYTLLEKAPTDRRKSGFAPALKGKCNNPAYPEKYCFLKTDNEVTE